MMKPIMKRVFAALLCVPLFAGAASAAEQRCDALGANCVCSEPLNTNSWQTSGGFRNPADSTTKECRGEVAAAFSFYAQVNATAVGAGSQSFDALPAARAVSHVWRTPDGSSAATGPWHFFGGLPPYRNVAFRYYLYHSPDFTWNLESGTSCQRGKYWYAGTASSPNMLWQQVIGSGASAGSGWGIANFLNTSVNVDCCNTGPFASPTPTINGQTFKGRWTRHEVLFLNANQSSGLVIRHYKQTLGLDAQNVLVLDTSTDARFSGMQLDGGFLNSFKAVMYGEGSCLGYTAFSHFMVAGWDGAYAGQLIGPASEIESADTVAPRPPTNIGVQ